MPSNLTLRRPREDEEEEFLRAHRATSPHVPSFLHDYAEGMPFRRYLEVLAEQEQGINLPSLQHVPRPFYSHLSEPESLDGHQFATHLINVSSVRAGILATLWSQSFVARAMPRRFSACRCTLRGISAGPAASW